MNGRVCRHADAEGLPVKIHPPAWAEGWTSKVGNVMRSPDK